MWFPFTEKLSFVLTALKYDEYEYEAALLVTHDEKIICVSSIGWHPGVIGIVASKLTEKFNRPSIVIAEDKEVCKASCRSVGGFDIGNGKS